MSRTVLLTRPEQDTEPLASEVKALGFDVFSEPMMEIKNLPVKQPDMNSYAALIFTSANGVRATQDWDFGGLPAYCVGNVTAEAAGQAGFGDIRNAGGDAADLMELLAKDSPSGAKPLLHVAGCNIARTIEVEGLSVKTLPVYEAVPVQAFSAEIIEFLDKNQFAAALFLSARTAQNFADLLEKCGRTDKISVTKALCLSDTVLKSVSHLPWQDVQVAKTPHRKALVEILENL